MSKLRTLVALACAYMVFAVFLNSVGTVILDSINSFHVSKVHASTLEPFKDITIAVVSFAVASFLPRLGLRRAIMLGLGLVAAACGAEVLAPSFIATQGLFLVVGASFALVKVSVYSSIGLLSQDRAEHVKLTSFIESLFMVGVLAGYWLFSLFIDPRNPGSLVWTHIYILLAGLCLVAILLVATAPLDEREARATTPRLSGDFLAMLRLCLLPLVVAFIASAFLYVLIEQGLGSWLPTFNSEILHLSAPMAVQAASIYAATLALSRFAAGVLMARFSWYRVLNICIISAGALVVLSLPLTRGLGDVVVTNWLGAPPVAFLFPMIGLFLAPIYPAINSAMLSTLPKHDHAGMTGLIVVFSALGGTLGSMLTAQIFTRFGGQAAFYCSLAPMGLLLVSLAVFRNRIDRQAGEAGPEALATAS
ncbi:MFS transporter [Phenylobacterium montanum]|uniref:MFS transporter n=1 Tax=Phenylobacterium montanum TaxID=2823693 RepID=A0A975FYR1_9CAUL|nr:MFS transporter [Caulobacter sp. S6]QUD87875.1 MFS transporter [Caulobacter sp. S6]